VRYVVGAEGFSRHPVELQTAGLFSGAHLIQDGAPARKGPKRGTYLLQRDDGTDATARLVVTIPILDPVPAIDIDGRRVNVVRPFRWYEAIWLGLPILLFLVGGALGALVGLGAVTINARLFRSQRPAPARYAMTFATSVASVIVFAVLATLFLAAVGS